jgi:hypothetical protein
MATAENRLTPVADRMPATVSIPDNELSGAQWISRFPASTKIDDLSDPFKSKFKNFHAALISAGASVRIATTFRPKERAYLMHWCYEIAKKNHKPQKIPSMDGVLIEWDHGDDAQSISAASAMLIGFGMQELRIAPALHSMHEKGEAVDMQVTWAGDLDIEQKDGTKKKITTLPRDRMNSDLHEVGQSYGVLKFYLGAKDKPHWSSNGT